MSWETGSANHFADLLTKLDVFLLKGHSLPPVYTGTGNGRISGVIGTAASVQETITITMTGATTFSVAGSITGAMGTGTVGTPYTHAKVAFTVNAGGTAWVNGDTISFVLTPPYQRKRLRGGIAHPSSVAFDVTKVVDGSNSTYTNPASASLPAFLGLRLLDALEVRSIVMRIYNNPATSPRDFTIDYSDNGGGSWTTAAAFTGITWSQAYQQQIFDVAVAPGAHVDWRVNVTACNGSTADISELTFHSATGGTSASFIPWFAEGIWQAPGNADESDIFMGIKLRWNLVGAYYNWRLGAFTGYDQAATFANQPGAETRMYLPLWENPLTYWFVASGKSVRILAKVSSVYEGAYLGFLDTYLSPGTYPYPMAVGGSMSWASEPAESSLNWKYTYSGENHRAFFQPYSTPSNPDTSYDTQLRVRRADGAWIPFANTASTLATRRLWPVCFGGSNLKANLDGSIPVFPHMLVDTAVPNVYGEFEGVAWVSGNNQSVENTITIGRHTWIVWQNVNQVAAKNYAAFRLE